MSPNSQAAGGYPESSSVPSSRMDPSLSPSMTFRTGNDLPVRKELPVRSFGRQHAISNGINWLWFSWSWHVSCKGVLSPVSRHHIFERGTLPYGTREHGTSSDHYICKPDESPVLRAREAGRIFLEWPADGLLHHHGKWALRCPARRMRSGQFNSGEEGPSARTTPTHAGSRWVCTSFSRDSGRRRRARNCLPDGQTKVRGRIVAGPLGSGGCPRSGETGFPGGRGGFSSG